MRSAACLARGGLLALLAALGAAVGAAESAALTDEEERWLHAGASVLAHADSKKMRLDVIVQPHWRAGDPPLAMAFIDGRCKLVLSMRGNPQTPSLLRGAHQALVPVLMEAVMAHEVGHCWRHRQGAWHRPAAGPAPPEANSRIHDDFAVERRQMHDTRMEEAYADLAALAWTAGRHPARYAEVQAWLASVRGDPPVRHGHHDTGAWVRFAAESRVFDDASQPFEQAHAVWQRSLGEGLISSLETAVDRSPPLAIPHEH